MTCFQLIERSESMGFEEAKINSGQGQRVVKSVRNNDRVLFKDETMAADLWSQVKPYVPERIGASTATGLNELFRFYRYTPGQQFRKHRDESFIRSATEASFYTFMIYLNDGFSGGATTFDRISIRPEAGKALIFLHDLEHSGEPITSGKKYVLRTDVMYRLD